MMNEEDSYENKASDLAPELEASPEMESDVEEPVMGLTPEEREMLLEALTKNNVNGRSPMSLGERANAKMKGDLEMMRSKK
jgi:hypothetical protein